MVLVGAAIMRWPCGGVAWRGVGIRVNLLEEAGGKW